MSSIHASAEPLGPRSSASGAAEPPAARRSTGSTTSPASTPAAEKAGWRTPPTRESHGDEPRSWLTWVCVLAVGLGVRAWIALTPNIGHLSDMDFFLKWARDLQAHGIARFFSETGFCDYPPLWLLLMTAVGHVVALFDPALGNEAALRSALKAPACLADLAIAVMLFVEGRRWLGTGRAVGASALWFLNPLSWYNSSYWGQVDAIHAAFCLLSLVFVNRQRPGLAGAAAAAAMLQKFQSVALLPLIIFEIFRRARFRGLAFAAVSAIATTAILTLPFSLTGTLTEVFRRGYVNVIGQYTDLSRSAYNVWWLTGNPNASDLAIPSPIVHLVSDGRVSFPDNASWLLRINWRVFSLTVYSLVVAVVLSVYAIRPGVIGRYSAGGLLGLAFFLFPTEMHERYALPAMAFLAFWAVTGAWRERLFVLLSAMLLLNVVEFLPPGAVSPVVAGLNLLVFILILLGLCTAARPVREPTPLSVAGDPTYPASVIIRGFQALTAASLIGLSGLAAYVVVQASATQAVKDAPNVIYLSTLKPRMAHQGWKELQRDKSVGGSMIHLGSNMYLRGLGTHAPSTLVYDIPEGVDRFAAVVGVNRVTGGKGSAKVWVEVDGAVAPDFEPVNLTGGAAPVEVNVAVAGARRLTLRADDGGDGQKADHVDWALARFVRTGAGADGP